MTSESGTALIQGSQLSDKLLIDRMVSYALMGMSKQTCRVYTAHLREFLDGGYVLTREGVQAYLRAKGKGARSGAGTGAASVNQAMSAVKKLAEEAAERNLISRVEWASIQSLHRKRQKGVRVGNWLTLDRARDLLNLARSKRDRALLALMIGCGLRREEAAQLGWANVQEREGRTILCDVKGKGGRVRSMGVPEWAAQILTDYREERRREYADMGKARYAGEAENTHREAGEGNDVMRNQHGNGGRELVGAGERAGGDGQVPGLFSAASSGQANRTTNQSRFRESEQAILSQATGTEGGRDRTLESGPGRERVFGGLTASGIWYIVCRYAQRLDSHIRPHDLRRTFAALSYEGGADIRQIQAEMGHASLETTERYLRAIKGLKPGQAAGDHIKL